MNDFVEGVARAMFPHLWPGHPAYSAAFERSNEEGRRIACDQARAAIKAMLTPSQAMIAAGGDVVIEREHPDSDCGATISYRLNEDAEAVWRAMAAAALPEPKVTRDE